MLLSYIPVSTHWTRKPGLIVRRLIVQLSCAKMPMSWATYAGWMTGLLKTSTTLG